MLISNFSPKIFPKDKKKSDRAKSLVTFLTMTKICKICCFDLAEFIGAMFGGVALSWV